MGQVSRRNGLVGIGLSGRTLAQKRRGFVDLPTSGCCKGSAYAELQFRLMFSEWETVKECKGNRICLMIDLLCQSLEAGFQDPVQQAI